MLELEVRNARFLHVGPGLEYTTEVSYVSAPPTAPLEHSFLYNPERQPSQKSHLFDRGGDLPRKHLDGSGPGDRFVCWFFLYTGYGHSLEVPMTGHSRGPDLGHPELRKE